MTVLRVIPLLISATPDSLCKVLCDELGGVAGQAFDLGWGRAVRLRVRGLDLLVKGPSPVLTQTQCAFRISQEEGRDTADYLDPAGNPWRAVHSLPDGRRAIPALKLIGTRATLAFAAACLQAQRVGDAYPDAFRIGESCIELGAAAQDDRHLLSAFVVETDDVAQCYGRAIDCKATPAASDAAGGTGAPRWSMVRDVDWTVWHFQRAEA